MLQEKSELRLSSCCPALFITAPASGQGKTTLTAALARYFTGLGKVVRIFKTGPDYLDPQILERASGQPVMQLDLWMAGADYCQQQLVLAADIADLILIEGAMGIFDGRPSSADLAIQFKIPILLIIDVKGMAQTAAALISGIINYNAACDFLGVILNHCGSDYHAQLVSEALPKKIPVLAYIKRDSCISLPQRHLGLVQAQEQGEELEKCFEAGVQALKQGGFTEHLIWDNLPQVSFSALSSKSVINNKVVSKQTLLGTKIAIAQDAAFSFIYHANLELLTALGASYVFFSPIHDKDLPSVDAIWLPGGYPELYAEQLSKNKSIKLAIIDIFESNKPILAECGGMLYCLQDLTDLDQQTFPMLGILSGQGSMSGKRGCQGMQTAQLPEGDVKAHAHHRGRSIDTPRPIAHGKRQRHSYPGEAIYRDRGLTATFLHLFFPSNPVAISRLFQGSTVSSQNSSTSPIALDVSSSQAI